MVNAGRNVLRRISVRLARADTGTPIQEWLKMPLNELFEWVNIISDENQKLEQELNKRKK